MFRGMYGTLAVLPLLIACQQPTPYVPFASPDGDAASDGTFEETADTTVACFTSASCGGGFCVDGACVACRASSDCKTPDQCVAGHCEPRTACQSDKPCTILDQVCNKDLGFCVECTSGADCPAGKACKADRCVGPPWPCKTSKDCAADQVCDKVAGVCVECVGDGDCPAGAWCRDTYCFPDACVPGSSGCADATSKKSCPLNGAAWQVVVCAAGSTCKDGACGTGQ